MCYVFGLFVCVLWLYFNLGVLCVVCVWWCVCVCAYVRSRKTASVSYVCGGASRQKSQVDIHSYKRVD